MDITPLISADKKVIKSYGRQGFKVNGELYAQSIIVFPDDVLLWKATSEISFGDFEVLLQQASELDVVLFGSGERLVRLAPELKNKLRAHGLNVEVMDSGAACRTYNVLMAEGRRVAAALLPV